MDIKMIETEYKKDLESVSSLESVMELRNKYLSKKGKVSELMAKMKDIPNEEKAAYGQLVNTLKNEITASLDEIKTRLENEKLQKKLESEQIDITLPSTKITIGAPNILEHIIEEVEEVFMSMGYDVVDGPEIETDEYCFEMLNVPKGHPARDAQDTFYITEEMLLRTQTSAMQVRYMLAKGDKGPFKMICPGKTYRRDDDDLTHSHQFHQVEGLVVGENISLTDLKGTLELFAKKMFGNDREIRFRASFFPFTEPSYEVDVSCFKCNKKGCSMCKGTGWIEILGCGMVHPNVLEGCGYDHNKYQGFAFGAGIERVACLKYGITVRDLYTNDYRFLRNFDRKEI